MFYTVRAKAKQVKPDTLSLFCLVVVTFCTSDAQVRTFGLKPYYFPWAKALLLSLG